MSSEAPVNNAQAAAAAAAEALCTAEFATRVELSRVEVTDGEENETVLHSDRSALYRFDDESNEWKERAKGDIQLLKHKETGKVRVLMRQDKTLKLRLNHFVPDEDLKPNPGSDKAWTWRVADSATEDGAPAVYSFAARFRSPVHAQNFKAKWNEARARNIAVNAGETFDESKVAVLADTPDARKEDKPAEKEAEKTEDKKEEKPVEAKKEEAEKEKSA